MRGLEAEKQGGALLFDRRSNSWNPSTVGLSLQGARIETVI